MLAWRRIPSTLGDFLLGCRADGSLVTDWPDHMGRKWPSSDCRDPQCLPDIALALAAYFDGDAMPLMTLDLPLPTTPPFYRACWDACRRVPSGTTITYSELASHADNARAIRAAGGAMRTNPVPILVPCHRVVATGGGPGGFAGHTAPGSPAMRLKRRLLSFEQSMAATPIHCKEHRSCA